SRSERKALPQADRPGQDFADLCQIGKGALSVLSEALQASQALLLDPLIGALESILKARELAAFDAVDRRHRLQAGQNKLHATVDGGAGGVQGMLLPAVWLSEHSQRYGSIEVESELCLLCALLAAGAQDLFGIVDQAPGSFYHVIGVQLM